MKIGRCPKCGSNDIYVSSRIVDIRTKLDVYACLSCHYAELYLPDDVSASAIASQWSKYDPYRSVGQSTIRLPPLEIEGTRTLYYGPLNNNVRPLLNDFYRFPDGTMQRPAFIALGQSPGASAMHLFYCDDHWNVLTKRASASFEQALELLEQAYVGATAYLQKL